MIPVPSSRETVVTVIMSLLCFDYLQVENSWGEDRGSKGYLVMSDDWFTEFTYEVVVDKKYIDEQVIEVLKQEPIVLPAWDPMGALA